MAEGGDITTLLRRMRQGDSLAESHLISMVYPELRMMAARYMRRERQGHTLQTTALVNEAYMKLVRRDEVDWKDRSQFFATAATIMRRILVDHARKHVAGKRGGGFDKLPLDEEHLVFAPERASTLIRLDEALVRLQEADPRVARVIELRFFGGLSIEETATALGTSERTVRRDWAFGRAWLRDDLGFGGDSANELG
ncbi:MAG: sigma-70 family RNA polymerase sigma factor [Bryobacteraceae bacterium]